MSIYKALETMWRGYHFRSRMEARWAVFFEATGIEYSYEPQGFDLGGVKYLPDFWLPQVKMWAEVKGAEFTENERDKARRLVSATGYGCLELVGDPGFRPYRGWWQWDPAIPSTLVYMEFVLLPRYVKCEGRFYFEPAGAYKEQDEFPFLYQAGVLAARSARFGIHDSA